MSRSKLRLLFWRWHRRFGIAAAVFIVLLSVTGIVLNHSSNMGLADTPVRQGWLLSLYGLKAPSMTSYHVGEHSLSHLGGDYLYLDEKELAYCAHGLSGAVVHSGIWVAACRDELLLLTTEGEVIERIGGVYGLPHPIERLGQCAQYLCLESGGQVYIADIDQLTFKLQSEKAPTLAFLAAKEVGLARDSKRALLETYYGSTITWERVMLDLHSGHLLQLGPWLMDLVALLMIVLSITGVTMWYSGQRRSRRR